MMEGDVRPVLLLEGGTSALSGVGVRREAIQGALITVSLFMGIPVLRSLTPSESASLLVYIGGQQQQLLDFSAPARLHYPARRPKGKLGQQMKILQCLPGVGVKRAKALLDKFETVEGVILASVEELRVVNGIGKKSAHRMKWVLQENAEEYVLPVIQHLI